MPLFGKSDGHSASPENGSESLSNQHIPIAYEELYTSIMVAEGNGRDLLVFANGVVIRAWLNRKNREVDWEKTIPLRSISAVMLRRPGKHQGIGYLQISYAGYREPTTDSGSASTDHKRNQSLIQFGPRSTATFVQVKECIDRLLLSTT